MNINITIQEDELISLFSLHLKKKVSLEELLICYKEQYD